ncbi:MAG: LamG domain-containing protein, partial [Patescibacteria group bacterium]|nr:LamG domain-containing protein [Patescibacteria group bacterium]
SGNPDPTTYAIGSNLSITPFIHGLVGYWPLNEGSGTTAYDNSGWNNNGTLLDATTTDTGPTWTTTGCLNGGSCLNFDGTDDYINLPSTTDIQEPITILLWFYSTDGGGYIFAADPGPRIFLPSNLEFNADIEINTAWQPWIVDATPITDNVWNEVAYVINGTTQSLYVNGNLISSGSIASGTVTYNSSTPFVIGADNYISSPYHQLYAGRGDGMRLYNATLTSAQIQAIYNAEKP